MIVYCMAEDCKYNKDRQCDKTQPTGQQFIVIEELFSIQGPVCTDYEERAEE